MMFASKNLFSRVSLLCLILFVAACEQDRQAENKVAETSDPIEVIDYARNVVRLPAPAERIVALAPHVVENLFTVGAGDRLVGVMQYSNFPAQALELPIVGGYQSVNFEKILELKPDLVIVWQTGNSQAAIARLKELGFPVYVDQPDDIEDVAKSLRDLGTLTGQTAQAEQAATEYLQEIASIREIYRSRRPVTFFYQIWNSPLQTINGDHIISDAIESCGGINIYANEIAVAPVINIESVLERNPEVIIASGMAEERPAWLDDWLAWPVLTAVQNDNLFYVNPDHSQRHTVRLLLGMKTICSQLEQARAG